jgi:hypothetical protein
MQNVSRSFFFLVLLPLAVLAQYTSAIEGTVTDASGAVLPAAAVKITDQNLGVTRAATANGDGFFHVGELAAGTYEVSVEARGFKTWLIRDLKVETSQTRSVFPALEVGAVTSEVKVTAEANAVNVATADVTNYIKQETIENQPLPQNTVWQLSILVPGVTGTGETGGGNGTFSNNYGGEMGIRLNADGQRQDSNEIMFNGSYAEVPSRSGSFMVSPIPDSIQEFRVEAANFSAVKGRQGGAFLELVSKSGSNDWHGTVGYVFSGNTLTARTIAEASIPSFSQHDGWVTVGGPIKKNKTFIFGAFDIIHAGTAFTSVGTVETPQFEQYVKSNFPKSIAAQIFSMSTTVVPTANIITVGQLKVQTPGLFDATSTIPNSLPAEGTATVSAISPDVGQQYQVRVDHNFSDKDRLFGYFYYETANAESVNAIRPGYSQPGLHQNLWSKEEWTHIFSPTFVNSASFRWSRASGDTGTVIGNALNEVPVIGITGTTGFGAWGPGGWYTPTWEWHELASMNRGKHNIQFGVEQTLPNDSVPWKITLTRPTFEFANLLDFAQDMPYSQSGPTINVATGQVEGAYLRYHTLFTGAFIQDDWKLKPWFTLNLGVRDDDYGHGITYTGDSDPGCYVFPATGGTFLQNIANGTAKCVKTVIDHRLWNLDPRFGFAWDVFHNGSMSVRGGYGMFRDRIPQNWFSTLNLVGPPLIVTPSLTTYQGATLTYGLGAEAGGGWPKPNVSYTLNAAGGVAGLPSDIMGIDPNIKSPEIQNWMLAIQKRLRSDLMLEINYTGSADHHLPVQTDINRYAGDLLTGTLLRPNPNFGQIVYDETVGNSFSNLLSGMVQRQFSKGLSLRAVYTYGKTLDDFSTTGLPISNIATTPVFDAQNLGLQRGRADFDIRNRFTYDATWAPPKLSGGWYAPLLNNWRLGTLGIFQSGLPFTVYTTAPYPIGDYNADGYNYDLPNSPKFGNSLSGLSRNQYLAGIFTASQFPVPVPGHDGDLGRNTFPEPGLINVNLRVMRQFHVPWLTHEGAALQFSADIFNVLNRANLDAVHNDLSDPLFGRSTDSVGPRSVQLGARLQF